MGQRKIRSIVLILPTLGEGGIQRNAVLLANALCSRYKVTIIVFWERKILYPPDPSVEVYCYPEISHGFSLHIRKNFPRLHKYLWVRKIKRLVKADVSVSYITVPNLANVFSRTGDRVICMEPNDPLLKPENYFREEKLAFFLADHVVFQSERVKGYFSKLIQKKSSIIPNPVSVPCKALPDRTDKIAAVGRLHPQKNHRLLIDAFFEFQKRHPEYILEIYGSGELEEVLKAQIRGLGLEDKVFLKGFVPNVHEQIRDAKMFVLSSDHEGLCNALLEAMMMGLACISTKVAGSTEVVVPMENGLLVDTGDREALTGTMLLLADDEALREKLERNAALISKKFDLNETVPMWESIL